MAPKNADASARKVISKGAWTAEEDRKLAQYIEVHGAKRWKTVAMKTGLNRCGKSCRLRWLNYLRPNIKRGNISLEEEDLILRLHKLLGNRWSLIAGRLPGRTDNEIKNYWNAHLSKKINGKEKLSESSAAKETVSQQSCDSTAAQDQEEGTRVAESSQNNLDANQFFDFSNEESYDLEWVNMLLELEQDPWLTNILCG